MNRTKLVALIAMSVLAACGTSPDEGDGGPGGSGAVTGGSGGDGGGTGGTAGIGGDGGGGSGGDGGGGSGGDGGSAGSGGDGGSGGGAGGSAGEGGAGGSGGEVPTPCGNGTLDQGESCDDGNPDSGDGCSDECQVEPGWDCSGSSCVPVCGDGAVVGTEECDGENFGDATCVDFGGNVGALACDETCRIDATACDLVEICGNGGDDDDNGLSDCFDPACIDDPICLVCGDDRRDGEEACDGLDLNGATCQSMGFMAGDLLCNETCGFDTSGCRYAECGDGLLEGTELCDGAELGSQTCQGLGFSHGTLGCKLDCTFDTTACVPQEMCGNGLDDDENGLTDCDDPVCAADVFACPVCGDGILSGNEECEDSNTEDGDGCSSACQLERALCDPNMVNLNTDATPTGNGYYFSGDSTGLGNHYASSCRPNHTEDLMMALHVERRSKIDFELLGGALVDSILGVRTRCADTTSELICEDIPPAGTPEVASIAEVPGGTMLYIDADRFLGSGENYPGGPFEIWITLTPIMEAGEACDSSTICAFGTFCGFSGTCEASVCGDGQVTSGEDCDDASDPNCDENCRRRGMSCASPIDLNALQTTSGNWTWAGTNAGAPSNYSNICGGFGANGPEVLGVFVPPALGIYRFDMSSSADDFFQVFEGPCISNPVGLACIDTGSVDLLLQPGVPYVVIAGDYSSNSVGTFTVTIDQQAHCGDGVRQDFERCDGTPDCSADCMVEGTCGDGVVDAGEECDDGVASGDQGCSRTCTVTPGWTCPPGGGACETICGDGMMVGPEECDDPANPNCGNCFLRGRTCQFPYDLNLMQSGPGVWTWAGTTAGETNAYGVLCSGYFGAAGADVTASFVPPATGSYTFTMDAPSIDNYVQVFQGPCRQNPMGQACVDYPPFSQWLTAGQTYFIVADGYSSWDAGPFTITATLAPACGDGYVSIGERCDGEPDCDSTCTVLGTCGDGNLDLGEECDDGNAYAEDGCALDCTLEAGWDCSTTPCEPICGDGVLVGPEECDNPANPACVNCGFVGRSCQSPYDLNAMETPTPGRWVWTGNTSAQTNRYMPLCAGSFGAAGRDATASFVAPASGSYTFTMIASYDEYLQLYEGPCSANPTGIACSDSWTFTRSLVGGQTYYVVADGYFEWDWGPFTVNVTIADVCGDGYVSGLERCDGEPDCDATCSMLGTCGDGFVDPGEECDDGVVIPGGPCANDCTIKPGWDCSVSPCVPVCGDGILIPPEECDDPDDPSCVNCGFLGRSCVNPFDLNALETEAGLWMWSGSTNNMPDAYGSCGGYSPSSPDRTAVFHPPVDGTYVVDMEASHDDFFQVRTGTCGGSMQELACVDTGAAVIGMTAGEPYYITADGWSDYNWGTFTVTVSLVPVCGDGYISAAERCDGEPDCDATCTMLGTCGDGIVDPGEECDDQNINMGDGCAKDCTAEVGWDCSTGVCEAVCGDGLVRGTEECDDPTDPSCVSCSRPGFSCRLPFDLNAMEASSGRWVWTGDTAGQPNTYPNLCGSQYGAAGGDLTAAFVAPVDGAYRFSMLSPHDDFLQVFSGPCSPSPAGSVCEDGPPFTMNLVAGETYYVVADGYSGYSTGAFQVTVELLEDCGDGYVSGTERCDGEPDCDATCSMLGTCGDGTVDPGEGCDPGDPMTAGCGLDCQPLPGWACANGACDPVCGDGIWTAPHEACDGALGPAGTTCDANCRLEPIELQGGDSVALSFVYSPANPAWNRPTSDCTGSTSTQYQAFTVTNDGSDDLWIEAVSFAAFDGYLHAYATPFVPGTPQVNCLSGNDDYQSGYNSKVLRKVLAGDSIVVVFSGYGTGSWGPVSIQLRAVPFVEGFESESNDGAAVANPLVAPSLIRGAVDPIGDDDYYAFTAQPGVGYVFETYAGQVGYCYADMGDSSDTRLFLFDSLGAQVATDDDSGFGGCSLISWRTPPSGSGGTYYLVVRQYSGSYTIDPYWLDFREIP